MTPSPTRRPRAAVAMVRDATGVGRDQLATKADLAAAIAGLESRMIEFGLGLVFANVTLTVALLKLL